MMVIRPVRMDDLNLLERCTATAGSGLVNLARTIDQLEKRIQDSIAAFSKQVKTPTHEDYLFVLAHTKDNSIAGTCSIYSQIGKEHPFSVLQISKMAHTIPQIPPPNDMRLLHPKHYTGKVSELCALYLNASYRKEGFGKLLSLSRFLFIACFPERFFDTILASLRGLVEDDYAPFWEGLGRKLIPLSFTEVMQLRMQDENTILNLTPHHSVYAALLSTETQNAIGKTHPHTIPAQKMLVQEGFKIINEIDPIDGGPILSCQQSNLYTIQHNIKATVGKIVHTPQAETNHVALLCNTKLDFRACYGTVHANEDGTVNISHEIAKALEIHVGNEIRYRNIIA